MEEMDRLFTNATNKNTKNMDVSYWNILKEFMVTENADLEECIAHSGALTDTNVYLVF